MGMIFIASPATKKSCGMRCDLVPNKKIRMFMTILQLINDRMEAALNAAGAQGAPAIIQLSSKLEFGDYQANGVMAAAKKTCA
ncbi:hypothetical protein ACFS07_32445 [Undibacterium arcticum]